MGCKGKSRPRMLQTVSGKSVLPMYFLRLRTSQLNKITGL
jgi:hypothetical protein